MDERRPAPVSGHELYYAVLIRIVP